MNNNINRILERLVDQSKKHSFVYLANEVDWGEEFQSLKLNISTDNFRKICPRAANILDLNTVLTADIRSSNRGNLNYKWAENFKLIIENQIRLSLTFQQGEEQIVIDSDKYFLSRNQLVTRMTAALLKNDTSTITKVCEIFSLEKRERSFLVILRIILSIDEKQRTYLERRILDFIVDDGTIWNLLATDKDDAMMCILELSMDLVRESWEHDIGNTTVRIWEETALAMSTSDFTYLNNGQATKNRFVERLLEYQTELKSDYWSYCETNGYPLPESKNFSFESLTEGTLEEQESFQEFRAESEGESDVVYVIEGDPLTLEMLEAKQVFQSFFYVEGEHFAITTNSTNWGNVYVYYSTDLISLLNLHLVLLNREMIWSENDD